MAWLWGTLVFCAGALSLLAIARVFAPRKERRLKRKLALPVALAERTLADALQELTERGPVRGLFTQAMPGESSDATAFVNPFDPFVERLARFTVVDLASLGPEGLREHEVLVEAMRTWNAAAGRVERVEQLLPIVMTGYHAAGQLLERLGDTEVARAEAKARVLFGLVGESDPRGVAH